MGSRFSILTDDLETCIECGRNRVQLHEIYGGNPNRKLSIKYGLVIPLCKALHHDGNAVGIHQDKDMRDRWRKVGQQTAMRHYGWDIEQFIKTFGKSYL